MFAGGRVRGSVLIHAHTYTHTHYIYTYINVPVVLANVSTTNNRDNLEAAMKCEKDLCFLSNLLSQLSGWRENKALDVRCQACCVGGTAVVVVVVVVVVLESIS